MEFLERYRIRLAASQADGFLALLGLGSGVIAALMIVAFRGAIDLVQQLYMADMPGEAFEWLAADERFLLAAGGGIVLGLIVWRTPPAARTIGIVHVLERLNYHQAYLSWRNLLLQFVTGAIALATGQSVGREAPSVHLGAGSASVFGRRLQVPNNTLRTLVACGAAAAIAASFNTPLAGVIFAMEVIMAEYTIAGFVPVILAAVAATAITRAVYGDATAFFVPWVGLESQRELLYIPLMGFAIGACSAGFVRASRALTRHAAKVPVGVQLALAGVLVGLIAIPAPAVMGLGYDTVSEVLAGRLALLALLGLFIAKFAASAICTGLRMPGGLIGPTVVMGSLAGAASAEALLLFDPDVAPALYAMLGMGAMMGAVLQAPLAALLALLEMTGNPIIILPAMLAVVSASLTARVIFRQDSVFTLMLRDAGLDYRQDPVSQGLRRVGVAAVMNRRFVECGRTLSAAAAAQLLAGQPDWLVIDVGDAYPQLLPAADLARHCDTLGGREQDIDLLSIPAERQELRPVHLQATLLEAREILDAEGVAALYIRRPLAPQVYKTFGIVRRGDVDRGYAFRG